MSGGNPKDPTDPRHRLAQVERELDALGESPADPEELLAAERLGRALEAPVPEGVPSEDPDTHELAELARILAASAGPGAAASPGQTEQAADAGRTDGLLDALIPQGAAQQAPRPAAGPARPTESAAPPSGPGHDAPPEAPASPEEEAHAARLGAQVDRLLAGLPPPDILPPGTAEDLLWASVLRAHLHAAPLSPQRLEALLDETLAARAVPAPAHRPRSAAPAPRRYRGGRVLAAVTATAALAASVVGLVLWWAPRVTAEAAPPPALVSRSTRDVLPRAFPPTQSPTERIDLIYEDRLQAYRAAHLGAWPRWRSRTRGTRRALRPTPALAIPLSGGGP